MDEKANTKAKASSQASEARDVSPSLTNREGTQAAGAFLFVVDTSMAPMGMGWPHLDCIRCRRLPCTRVWSHASTGEPPMQRYQQVEEAASLSVARNSNASLLHASTTRAVEAWNQSSGALPATNRDPEPD